MKKPPVDRVKIFSLLAPLICWPNMKLEEGLWGAYLREHGKIQYDPEGEVAKTIVHESGHGYRCALSIESEDSDEEEKIVGRAELAICSFIEDNPLLSLWIVKELIVYAHGEKKWSEVLSQIEGSNLTEKIESGNDPIDGRAT